MIYTKEKGIILEPPKTDAGNRVVDLDRETVAVLQEHADWQQQVKEAMGEDYVDRGRVFTDSYGGWVTPSRLYRTLKQYGERLGYKGVTIRSLRHFHASLLLQSGQNLIVVSKRLGHSRASMTSDTYAHSLPGWQREAAEAFANAMDTPRV